MGSPRLAAGIYQNLAELRATNPFTVTHYAYVLGGKPSGLFAFVPGSPLAQGSPPSQYDDGWSVIIPTNPTVSGAWILQPEDDRGPDITQASGALTIGVYGGPWRVIPAGLTGALTVTLSPFYLDGATLIPRGSKIEVTRSDASGNTVTFVNGGTNGGVLSSIIFPANWLFWFDGAQWLLRRDAQLI
jgi:hypothetical protein